MTRLTLTFWVSFFIFCFGISCKQKETRPAISVITKDNKSVGISIKDVQIRESEHSNRLKIFLAKESASQQVPVLGQFTNNNNEIIFEPVVPFTSGLNYLVMLDDSLLAEISIPLNQQDAPDLISIYPTCDTVPENLLKVYLEFSQPMVEGKSLDYITLVRTDGDTMKGTFLDLQPELWNVESTMLTLWLDPGRIKRDLIPNKELGIPLVEGQQYLLHVNKTWPGKSGLTLSKHFQKKFVVVSRDEVSPNILSWTIVAPKARTASPLVVRTPESIDYTLFHDALHVFTAEGDEVTGRVEISNNEKTYRFLPEKPWSEGKYVLKIESRLEDLAGNNLNRPFDRDVESVREQSDQEFRTKEFEIH